MKTCAILVTYYPDKSKCEAVISSVISQVSHIIIVDNTPNEPWGMSSNTHDDQCTLIKNNSNVGLSKAQNMGIRWAIDHGYDYVLILDQDRVLSSNMVKNLLEASKSLTADGINLAAVGPKYGREDTPTSSFLRFTKFHHEYIACNNTAPWKECSFLISSGMLISVNMFAKIGMMDSSLFIDHVDTEWCMRAMSRGYVCYGIGNAFMTHALGERSVHLWWGRERNIAMHHPFRLYYIFRNSIVLYQRHYIPMRWKLFDLKRLILLPFFYLIFSNQRLISLKHIFFGIIHGLQGVKGEMKC